MFREDVVSPVGARGLMQIMPATAHHVSRQFKIPYKDKQQLFDSQKNILIGIAYLNGLGRSYSHHPVLMAAAYNAGPGRVKKWIQSAAQSTDIWIETIPWQETRNYLKNVVAFYAVYQYRMQKKSDLSAVFKPI